MTRTLRFAFLAAALAFAGAAHSAPQEPGTFPGLPEPLPPPGIDEPGIGKALPVDTFFADVAMLCGRSYRGRVVTDEPAAERTPFAGKPIEMRVFGCDERSVRMAVRVGDDQSRTWVLVRTAGGLQLTHEHRGADGHADALTGYGGASFGEGSATRQAFPADPASAALFRREGRDVSVDNTWALQIAPGRTLLYEMSRPGGRLFQLEFDLANPTRDD